MSTKLLLVAVVSALLLGVLNRHANAVATDVTYQAALTSDGNVLITFTPDLSGVTRAEVQNGFFEWVVPSSGETLGLSFSHHLYFDPPLTLTHGQFELNVPGQLFGMARNSVRIDGTIGQREISGIATLVTCVYPVPCFDLASVAWKGSELIDTAPAASDTIYAGHVDGQERSEIELALDADDNVTSFAIKSVVATSCFDPPRTFNVRMFFDPPVEPGVGVHELVGNELAPLDLTFSTDVGTISGDLSIGEGVYATCIERLTWSVVAETPPPTSAPISTGTVAPLLPPTGAGPPPSATPWWVGFAALAAIAVSALGLAHARRAG